MKPATHRRALAALALASCAFAVSPALQAQRRHHRRHTPAQPPPPATAATAAPGASAAPSAPVEPVAPPPVIASTAVSAPVAPVAPSPVVTTAPLLAPQDDGDAPRAGRRYLDAFVAFAPYLRSYEYHQDLFNRLRPYFVPFAPAVGLSAAWYPGAHFTAGPGSWFGLAAEGSYTVGLSSRDGANNRYTTTAYSYSVGLSVRVPLGRRVELGARVAYAGQRFAVDATNSAMPGIPSMNYQLVRIGLEGRFALARHFALLARGGYDVVLAAGEVFSTGYFPRGSAGAAEAGVGLAVPIVAGLELRLTVDARRYFFSFAPEPGDRYVAGGALDQYVTASGGFALRR